MTGHTPDETGGRRDGHAARDNGWAYWAHLTWNTASYYVRQRRWAALARALYLVIGRGYYLEICQVCGRRVGLVWHAADDLYEQATGAHGAGIYCPECFDIAAERAVGPYLIWRPEIAVREAS